MVSQVKGPGTSPVTPLDSSVKKLDRAAVSGAQGPPSDAVTLTDLAARLQNLMQSIDKLPIVDQVKVTELRDAIGRGDYQVDDAAIADKLSTFEALLSSRDPMQ